MTHPRDLVAAGMFVNALLAATALLAESNVSTRTIRGEPAPSERDEQESLFNDHFRAQKLVYQTEFAKLKTSAQVDGWRIPYSAAIYPERSGGLAAARSSTGTVLGKYDSAFHDGRSLAESYDRRRKLRTGVRRAGLFGRTQTYTYYDADYWEGYCSGFTASTIRHPEPVRPVDAGTVGGRSGVVFEPAEIKALLSAAYNRTRWDSFLFVAPASARDGGPNMGTFHLALANYIGQAGHPIGIDRVKGREAWNNPIYDYEVTSIRDAGHQGDIEIKELVTKITYTGYGTDRVNQTNPDTGERQGHQSRSMVIRYQLELDAEGKIVGGRALSHAGHSLWIPLFAVQGVPDQSSPGNPHLDVQKIIALARRSALPDIQAKYDRVVIGQMIDPQIAVRAEAQRLREVAAQTEAERE
ncbi:MAG TPA: hypothetical protein PLF81_13630 [Candidatus Anammoximicrobium sp.]|nr:hypothetical protein [Candidatus Anammoximicrobium sp.]